MFIDACIDSKTIKQKNNHYKCQESDYLYKKRKNSVENSAQQVGNRDVGKYSISWPSWYGILLYDSSLKDVFMFKMCIHVCNLSIIDFN